jgi:hypothetical protein
MVRAGLAVRRLHRGAPSLLAVAVRSACVGAAALFTETDLGGKTSACDSSFHQTASRAPTDELLLQ